MDIIHEDDEIVTDSVIRPSSSVGRITRDMKSQFLFSAVIGMLLIPPVFGHVEELDFHYWYSAELPLPGGWAHDRLYKGVEDGEWKGGAYFKYNETGWLLSPVFSSPIRSVTLSVATTVPEPSSRLCLHPIVDGVTMESGMDILPTESRKYTEQVLLLNGCSANQFVLKFPMAGKAGNWGMERIIVRYGDASTDDELPLRSWSIAEVARKPGYREADFALLQYIATEGSTPWRNGITVDGFHAFLAGESCTKISLASSATPRYSGLYALDETEGEGTVRMLALKSSGDNSMSLMLPVALDAKRTVARLSVAYRVWGLPEGVSKAVIFSYRILNDLTQMTVKDAEWKPFGDIVDAKAVQSVELSSKDLRDGSYVCFRWHVPERENCPAIGISDVRVSAEIEPSGFAVIVK